MFVRSYVCNSCGLKFTVIMEKYSKKKLKCQKCEGKDISAAKEPAHRGRICPNLA